MPSTYKPMRDPNATGPCAGQCGRKARIHYSKYCCTCSRRIARNGSPHAIALNVKELEPYRKAIASTVHRHLNSKAIQGALALAAELLNYQPSHDFTYQTQLREQMQRLQSFGVTPEQVVCRVAEFVAWQRDHQIANKREQDCKLALVVLKLAPLRGWHKRSNVLRALAQLITEDGLWRFACGLLMKIEQDHTDRVNLVKALDDYSAAT